jgi:hypothetical protein
MRVSPVAVVLAIFLVIAPGASAAAAQEATAPAPAEQGHVHDEESGATTAAPAWSWSPDANVFVGYNYQQREFTDQSAFESQNWFMLHGTKPMGGGQLQFEGMLSLEPLTMQPIGSPQLFQTGESYQMGPLIDRQHPHDFLMELGGTYRRRHGRVAFIGSAYLVGPAALGPTPFMHRESARSNPQAPLTHHQLDSTHITPGVLTGGVEVGRLTFLGSWFRGREPDENRWDIGRPWLDSWSVQGKWRHGPWQAQVSGGILHEPEWFEPYDIPRITASIEFTGKLRSHPVAATVAWGENREIHGILDGYLFEWDAGVSPRGHFYGRAEASAKDLLDLGFPDPPGFVSFHRISHVAAVTAGYLHEFLDRPWGRLGLGGDATFYHVPENMVDYYGTSPHSFHVFVRYRPRSHDSMTHQH